MTSLIAELREAIGDEARAPRLVRTIHAYGYAFIGHVTAAQPPTRPIDSRSYRVIVGDREVPLALGVHIIGRSPDVAICVDDSGVSRHHAQIMVGAGGATLEDLASKNGTVLEGRRVEGATALKDGSTIVVGATALRFRVFEALSTTETITRQP